MKIKIIVMLCLTAGLVMVVFLANKYHWLSTSQRPVAQVKDLIPAAPTKAYPDTFPKELIFDMSPIDSIETDTSVAGKAQITAKYVSPNPIGDFARAAKQMLELKKWTIITGKDDPLPKEIVATRGTEKVTVSLSLKADQGTTSVTVVYEK